MKSPSLIQGAQALLLAACTAGVVAATALAAPVGRPPDVRDAAAAAHAATPDVIERDAATRGHSFAQSGSPSTPVSRPPDIDDAAVAAHRIMLVRSSRFAWDDFAAGVGTGAGTILFLAGCLAVGRLSRRHRLTAQ